MTERSAVLAGIGLMLAAMLMFSLNDVLGKWLVATYSVGQILLIRSAAGLAIMTPFILKAGRAAFAGAPHPGLQVLRVVFSTLEVACFYLAVWYMPLADAMTFYLAGPIYVTALSALFLGEHVGPWRWGAVLVGFGGVVIALNPSAASIGWGSPVALAGSMFFAMLIVTTRKLRGTSNVVLTTTQVSGALLYGAVAAPLTWTPVRDVDYLLLGLLGVVSLAAFALVNLSLRLAPASAVTPYQYTMLLWAIIFGFIFFGDVPQSHTLIGAAIIIGSGLFIFIREQRMGSVAEPATLKEH